jgi:hypothetical protein
MDNFYSSVGLFKDVRQNDIEACGTVRANRKGLPTPIKGAKMKRGELPRIWISRDKEMLACTWQDTGRVNMLSTVGNTGVSEVKVNSKSGRRIVMKPNVQVQYNRYIGCVDRFDHTHLSGR